MQGEEECPAELLLSPAPATRTLERGCQGCRGERDEEEERASESVGQMRNSTHLSPEEERRERDRGRGRGLAHDPPGG